MANLLGLLRKTARRGVKAVRNVGRFTRKTVKRGTNAVGLTKRGRKNRASRRNRNRQ